MTEYAVIGKRLPRIDAKFKVTGEARYIDDMVLPRMLYGKVLRSPYPHARILNIDASRALKLPGVKAVATGKDTAGIRIGTLRSTRDRQLLPTDKVRFLGEGIAAVAAVDEDTAVDALGLIKVDYEELPAVFDAEEALKEGAPLVHDHIERNIALQQHWRLGNVEKGFAESDYVREDDFEAQWVMHGFMEPFGCIATWDATGKLTLYTGCQNPFFMRRDLAQALELPLQKVRISNLFIGGGFGGKGEPFDIHMSSALLSKKTGLPVKMVWDKREEFVGGIRRLRQKMHLKTGVKRDGTLVAQSNHVIANGGAYISVGLVTIYNSGLASTLPYRLPNFNYDCYRAYTNNPVCGPMRGHGQFQVRFAVESQLDMIAEELGLDPVEIRIKNSLQPGDITANKLRITTCGLTESIKKAVDKSGWHEKRGKRNGRGVGLACGGFACGARLASLSDSGNIIKVNDDGGLVLLTGATDLGQGCTSIFAQIVAEVLGVSQDEVEVISSDTELTPYDPGTYSSRVTFYAGNSVKRAAEDLRRQIAGVVAGKFKVDPQELEFKNHSVYLKTAPERKITFADAVKAAQASDAKGVLFGKGTYYPPTVEWPDPQNSHVGNISGAYSFFSEVAEVEVDMETGHIDLLRTTIGDDCGYALNPMAVEGQVEGSVSTGQGTTMYEDVQMEKGKLLNPNLMDYKMPTVLDTPKMDTIHITTNDPEGPFGAKEVGEGLIIATPGAIANAVHDATGVWIKDLPITAEKVLKALREKEGRKT